MRMARLKVRDREAVYHCISRVVGGEYLLSEVCRERFRKMLWQQADFCGMEVLTYCVMSNHVHLLVRVPSPQELTDREVMRRALALYGSRSVLVSQLRAGWQAEGRLPEDLRTGLVGRMGDVSVFMKELKQRFSRWYNRVHGRFGTLWAERFRSLLVEDQPGAVRAVGAYIDLNPVRAGLVQDPKDYRFSGYGEAMGGSQRARAGIMAMSGAEDWASTGGEYRQLLYGLGGEGKRALDPEGIREVQRAGGQLGVAEALRLRLRYLSDGVALGSEAYVNEVFREFRNRFGPKRRSGARPLRGLPFTDLRTLRDLRRSVCG